MDEATVPFLLYIARKGGFIDEFSSSTGEIALDLGVSQQTISRRLQSLASENLIIRKVTPFGVTVSLSDSGRNYLRVLYGELKGLFEKNLVLRGRVVAGLGEGKFYMSQKGYTDQFASVLGFVPYQGTLNLTVDPNVVAGFLATRQMHYINGFDTPARTFGGIKCYLVTIHNNITGAIILPDRSLHTTSTIELIAPTHLRDTLQLENGSEVVIQ